MSRRNKFKKIPWQRQLQYGGDPQFIYSVTIQETVSDEKDYQDREPYLVYQSLNEQQSVQFAEAFCRDPFSKWTDSLGIKKHYKINVIKSPLGMPLVNGLENEELIYDNDC